LTWSASIFVARGCAHRLAIQVFHRSEDTACYRNTLLTLPKIMGISRRFGSLAAMSVRKAKKLSAFVARFRLAQHLAGSDIERRKQAERAVTLVLEAATFDSAPASAAALGPVDHTSATFRRFADIRAQDGGSTVPK
jgi:hypothetical protein